MISWKLSLAPIVKYLLEVFSSILKRKDVAPLSSNAVSTFPNLRGEFPDANTQ